MNPNRTLRPYIALATLLLLLAAFFRLWNLGTTPPGLLLEERHNIQIAGQLRDGNVALVYDSVEPGREGLYNALLAASGALLGHGLILWRMPSVWLSLLALSVTFSLVRRLVGGRVALVTLAYLAVAFWPIWLGTAVLHVTLMPLVTATFGYTMVRAFTARHREESGLWFAMSGIALGVAQYAHVSAYGLLLVTLGFLTYLAATHRHVISGQWSNVAYMLLLAAFIFAPLFVFVVTHPGARVPLRFADQPGWLSQVPERLLRTLGGLFLHGDSSPDRNLPARPILDPLSGALFVVGVGIALARWRRARAALLLIWFALGLVPALLVSHVPHFEYMALLMPVAFIFPALALDELHRLVSSRARLQAALAGLVVLLVAANAVWTFRDRLVRWPTLGDVRFNYQADVAALARYLDTSPDPSPVGLCVVPVTGTDDPFALPADRLLDIFMHRSELPIRKFDCRQSLVLAAQGAEERLVFLQGYFTDLPGPLLAWLQYSEEVNIRGVPPGVVRRVEASEQLADFLGSAAEASIVSWPPEASGGPGPTALPVPFTENLRFDGYHVRKATLLPGEPQEIVTYWSIQGPVPDRLLLFVHLQGGPGQILTASQDFGADPRSLQPGDAVLQYNLLQPDPPLVAGDYRLVVGMLVPGTEHRLRALDAGLVRSDRLLLQRVTIVE